MSWILLLLAACSRAPAAPKPTAPPGEVWITPGQIAAADLATEPVAVHEVGSLRASGRMGPDEAPIARVFSPVDGRVVAVSAAIGQRVTKGDPLASIDVPENHHAARDLREAEAEVVAAERDEKRMKELYLLGEPRRDMEAMEGRSRDARTRLDLIRARARLLLPAGMPGNPFLLRAPIDGEILGRTVELGPVRAFRGGAAEPVPLFVVGERPRLAADTEVPEGEAAKVASGQKVRATLSGPSGRTFEGKVDWVSSLAYPSTRTGMAHVHCVLPDPTGALEPATAVTLVILTGEKRLAVPWSAVVRQGEQTVVFVGKGEGEGSTLRFERRAVELDDDAAGEHVAVRAGVVEGEPVVRKGAALLSAL